jgi:hypothetical protein
MAVRALTFDRKLFEGLDQVRMWLACARRGSRGPALGALCVPGQWSAADSRDDWLIRPQAELLAQAAVDRLSMPALKAAQIGQGVTLYEDQ